jgi:hypothetical protein
VSVLHPGLRTITLAPLYDVAPTAWFLPVQNRTALPVGGKWKISEITRAHLRAEAEGWGMPAIVARSIIDGTLAAMKTGITEANDRFPAAPPAMREAVEAQLRRLASGNWE